MKLHAIMIAVPLQGHLNPFLNLAIHLATKGFTITFVHTEYTHHLISKSHGNQETDLFEEARDSGLDIRYMTISDGFPFEFDRDSNVTEFWGSLINDFPTRVDRLVGTILESLDSSFVPVLVADTVYAWPATIAQKYNLVNVSFWTEPALVFAITYYIDLLKENGHFPPKDNQDETISYIPGVDSINTKDLMSYVRQGDTTTITYKIVSTAFEQVQKADFLLCNTVQELESNALTTLNQNKPTYAIGPINFSTKTNVSRSLRSETDCTKWLDSKPRGSVLYVSFGSVVRTNKEAIEEIAHGLLLSEVNFIWVVRSNIVGSTNESSILPFGFEDCIKDRGLIVPWCDQNAVLSNLAIGGFLTHCGWNSILESMWCGVPMICYPITYDQPTNKKMVVDDWKVGINLCDGEFATRDEVAMKIKSFMKGEVSSSVNREMKKVQSIVHNALREGGSSTRNFDQFLEDLRDKIHSKNEVRNK